VIAHETTKIFLAPNKASLDSSLKRHTALIKRTKLSIGLENRDQNLKDIETLTLEKYVEEIASSLMEGLSRCKTDKDIWAATEVPLYSRVICFLSMILYYPTGYFCGTSPIRECIYA
jgi:hypothetical protein